MWFKKISSIQLVPMFYGYCWKVLDEDSSLFCPMPFNWVLRFFRRVLFILKGTPMFGRMTLEGKVDSVSSHVNSVHSLVAQELKKFSRMQEGILIHIKDILERLEKLENR